MVGIDAVTRSLHVHWADAFSGCATVHPGEQLDVGAQTAWVELWVDAWDEQPRRNDGPERMSVAVTVHCFSRHATETAELRTIADAARVALARQLIAVRDYEQSGSPLVGYVRLRETELRDLTRVHDEGLRGSLRHVVVLCRGVAEGV